MVDVGSTVTSRRHIGVAYRLFVYKGIRYVTDYCVTFDALAPKEPLLAEGANDVSENSVVLRVTYLFLRFTGLSARSSPAMLVLSRRRVCWPAASTLSSGG